MLDLTRDEMIWLEKFNQSLWDIQNLLQQQIMVLETTLSQRVADPEDRMTNAAVCRQKPSTPYSSRNPDLTHPLHA
jgi:hypothetical protein